MYQKHCGLPAVGARGQPGGGPVFGHVVSRDLVHWARMPVAVWNDRPYDTSSIFSGSCVSRGLGGVMTLIYPGVCPKGSSPACATGTTVNLAIPADPTDPLATNFSKLDRLNPICQVNGSVGPGGGGPPGSGGDSSAAWRTASGEWRILTRDAVYSNAWCSDDFMHWRLVGPQPGFPGGACPSFFPMPKAAARGGATAGPTHVYMYSDTDLPKPRTHQTVAIVGRYYDMGKGLVGKFEPTPGVRPQIIDNGTYYAAKDFWDQPNGRRIVWGWAQVPGGCQSLPRQLSWHPELEQLLFAPIDELAALRVAPPLATLDALPIRAGRPVSLGRWPEGAANQSEVRIEFPVTSREATFGIGMLAPIGGEPTLEAFVDYTPSRGDGGYWVVAVGIRPAAGGEPGVSGELRLTAQDKHVQLRVFTDHVLTEVFFNGGRVALTYPVAAGPGVAQAQFTAFSTVDTVATGVRAHRLSGIWVPPVDVAQAAVSPI